MATNNNPFEKYLEASQRQRSSYNDLSQGIEKLKSEYETQTPDVVFKNKTINEYAQDLGISALRGAVLVPQVAVGLADIAGYGAEKAAQGYGEIAALTGLVDRPQEVNYTGHLGKALAELGLDFKTTQEVLDRNYSDPTLRQKQELKALGEMNLDNGLFSQNNGDVLAAKAGYILDNPSLAVNEIITSLPLVGAASVIGNAVRGAAAVNLAARSGGAGTPEAIAAANQVINSNVRNRIGYGALSEGAASAGLLQETSRQHSDTGLTTPDQTMLSLAVGGGVGALGYLGGRAANRAGVDDIDSMLINGANPLATRAAQSASRQADESLPISTVTTSDATIEAAKQSLLSRVYQSITNSGAARVLGAANHEGLEEIPQENLENFGENLNTDRGDGNILYGNADSTVLGYAAGFGTGAGMRLPSAIADAASNVSTGLNKIKETIKDKATLKSYEKLSNPDSDNYDPAKAFNSQVPDLNSADETVRAKAQENMDSIFEVLNERMIDLRIEARKYEITLEKYNALSEEDRKLPDLVKEKQDAEKALKQLKETIVKTDNQYGDLYLQKLALEKNQEVQAGIPQYSEEQAKADIELLSQEPTSTTVWATEDNEGNPLSIPVTAIGSPVATSDGYETIEVKYTDSTGKERTTYAPISELVQDTTTQQEAAQRITKHFSKLSVDELDIVSKSPYLTEEQRNSLRYLSQAKRAIASLASPTDVTNHIMNGLKGKTPMESHRGLNTYTDMVNAAINTKDERLLNIALNDLGRFAQDHTDKANALTQANGLVTSGQFSKVQVLRSNDGTWGIVTDPNKFVDDIKLKATAGWNVTANSNKKGAIDLVSKEATLIQDTLKALTQVGLSFALQAVEPTVTPPVTVEALREANKPVVPSNSTDDITSAITRLNKYNKSGTPLTVDSVTPEALQTLQTKVSSAFELGAVNQQTYDGVTKDIATLQQYLSSTKPNKQNQEVNTSDVVSQTKATEAVNTKATSAELSDYVNHSGGAYGADTLWDTIGRSLGFINHNHYRDSNNTTLSAKLKQAGVKAVKLSEKQMETARNAVQELLNKTYPDTVQGNLQVRNYYQVANSDGVYAIAALNGNNAVKGGTNTAVQLGIKLGKPVYVWDINTEQWYKFDTNSKTFKATKTPTLTKNFAGVGTRDIENYNVLKNGKWVEREAYVGDEKAQKAQQAIKDVYEKTLAMISNSNGNSSNTSTQTEPTQAVATEPTKDSSQDVEALHENAKPQDANIKPTENAEVLQEVDVVLPLVQQPVNLFEREDGSWSDDLLKAKEEIRKLYQEELKKWGEVNKPIPKGSFINSLHIAFNPISDDAKIGLESSKSVDAALALNVSLNALWALRLILAKAYNSLQKSHAKRLKEKSGDYFSFRSKDDPKYEEHQKKLDALRQEVENAISTLKIALNALDKAILEKTKGTSEQSQTEISSNAKGLAAALTNPTELAKSKGNITKSYPVNFNGKTYRDAEEAYQKLKHLATKDSGPNSTYNLMVAIIKAKLEQHPSLVSEITKQGGSEWILSSVHQPTKQNTVWETGGKNWFIKALNEAYLSQIKPIVETKEVDTPTTSTQTEPNDLLAILSKYDEVLPYAKGEKSQNVFITTSGLISEAGKRVEKLIMSLGTEIANYFGLQYEDVRVNNNLGSLDAIRQYKLNGKAIGDAAFVAYKYLNTPELFEELGKSTQATDMFNRTTQAEQRVENKDEPEVKSTEATPPVSGKAKDVVAGTGNIEPQLDTTTSVEAATAEDTIDVSEAPNTKETQTSDDAEALIEALKTEAEKRVTLTDEDTLESEALNELVSLAYGNGITKEDLKTVKELFGEDLVEEAERIRNLPLSKKHEAQKYLEQIRLVIGNWGTVKTYVDEVIPEDLNTYKKLVFDLMEKRKQDTSNASKIFDVLTAYVTQNQPATAQPETKVESDEATQSEPKDEVSDSIVNGYLTTEDVKQILIERYGEDVVNALIKKGLLTIHQSLPNGFNTKGAKFSKNAQIRDAAIRQAREAVRELLVKLNFKFVESPNIDISELERIASKYITGLHNDDETFLKEAAKALSYALYHDINGGDVKSVGKNIPRTEIETVILYWLKNGTLPHNAPSLWKRIIFTLKKLLNVFNGKLYESVSEKLEDTINKIITGESFSYTPKAGYAKLNFQREMDNNPNAVSVLKSLVKSGQPFVLTGSVAYADQVPVYRDPHKPLHDIDLLFPQGKAEEAYQWFKKGDPNTWGDIVKLYEFTREGKKVIGTAVVPTGYEIVNVKSFWNAQAKRPQRSYDVYSKETNMKVGSYFFLQGETEKFEGIAGITVDIMEDKGQKTVEQQFTDNEGKPLTIKVASYEGGFAAKLEMLREKDINDFKLVIPRDVTNQAKQSISTNNNIEGFYQDGKVHLIADNLTAETVVATLVHELSGHLGFQELLDKDTYLALLDRFKQLVEEGDEVAIAAKKRAEAATDNQSEQESEYLPYLLSEYLTAKAKKGKLKTLFEAVVNSIKTALSELFTSSNIPTSISNSLIAKMTTSDIVYLAERMVSGVSSTVNQPATAQPETKVETTDTENNLNASTKNENSIAATIPTEEEIIGTVEFTEDEQADGKVTVLQGVTEEVRQEERNKPFSLRNLIKAYFTQKEADATNSPLVLVKDFISQLDFTNNSNLLTQLSKYLGNKTKVTDAHIAQLTHFKEFRNKLAPVIQRVLDNEFANNPKDNIVRDLLSINKLDENTITAIAIAAYGYLIRYGTSVTNTDDDIKAIVRLKKDSELPPNVAEYLRYVGQEAPYLEYELGEQVSKLLGLKVLKDSGVNLQGRLEKAFGNIVTMSLHDVGYIVIDTSVNPKVLGAMLEEADIVSNDPSNSNPLKFEDNAWEDEQEGQERLIDVGRPHAISNMNKMTFIRINYDVLSDPTLNRNYRGSRIEVVGSETQTVTVNIDYTIRKARRIKDTNGEISYPLKDLVWGTNLQQKTPNDVNTIINMSKGTGSFLGDLFGTSVGYSTPQIVETKGLLNTLKQATKTAVSKLQRKLIGEAQTLNVFTIRTNTVKVLETLQGVDENSRYLKELLGIWIDDDVLARTYVEDREGLQAKATNEWRMLENGLSWANAIALPDGTYLDFYDTQYMAQNERQHYSSNLFNMQTSLIHRAIGTIKGGVTIKFDSVNTDKNYQRFLQAVGEGLEGLDSALKDTIKSFTPKAVFYTTDKTDGEIYTYALEQYLAKPENLDAIEAMAAVIEGAKPNRLQRKAIAQFVKAGDMGIQSLQSLIALAEMQVAINQGKDSFTTSVGLGSDGVNNGVATANILTGVITREMKQQVGMMPKQPTEADAYPAKTMQEVYGKGLPDYYISFGLAMAKALQALRNEEPESDSAWRDELQILFPIYKAIPDAFIEMRKIAKTWSVPFNYSAGIDSLQRALANGFMKGIIKEITAINNQALTIKKQYVEALNETDSAEDRAILTLNYNNDIAYLSAKAETLEARIEAVVDRSTQLTDVYGKPVVTYKFNEVLGFSEPRPVMVKRMSFSFPRKGNTSSIDVFGLNNYKLPEAVVSSLKQAVQSVHGVAAWNATQQYAFHYSQATSMLNAGNNASYTLYQSLRKALIEAKLNDKIDEKLAKYGGLKGFNDRNAQIAEENNQITAANRKLPKGVKWQPLKPSYDNRERNDVITEVKYLGLSAEELQEIDDILASIKPMLHSPLSNKSGKITEGISLVNTTTINLKPEANQQVLTRYQDKYSQPVKGLNNNAGLRDEVEESAGIKALALAVQGMDAYVASHVQAKFPGINVHDAYIFSPDQFVEGTKYQNQIYLEGITEYHLGMAHAEAFVNSYLGLYAFSQAINSLNLNQEYKDSLKNAIKEQMFIAVFGNVKKDKKDKVVFYVGKDGNKHISYTGKFKGIFFPLQKKYNYAVFEDVVEQPRFIIETYIKELINQDLAKLEALKDIQAVHQYSGDGGAYVIGVGGDITEAEHLKNIEEQIKLVKLKEATLLKALENNNKTFELSRDNKDPKTELVKLLETNKGKPLSIQDVLTILKAVPASAKSSDAFEQQLAIIREIEPLLDGVSIVYADMVNDEEQGIDDYVQGAYDESSNTITIRANTKYPPTAKLVLHEILHSGLAARITYLENLPETDTQYAKARAALKQLDNLRKEILANLVEGVDASKYFELKAAFEKSGGWEAYKQAQQKLKEAKNSAYAARGISIETLKKLRLDAYEELNAQKAELQAAKGLEKEALDGLRAFKFGSLEYQTARLQQQAALAAIKEIKQELQQKYENIANINTQLDRLYASNLKDELNSDDIANVALAREFLTLHSALKNTVFTINSTKEVTALDVVNWLVNTHEFISYGLTEESLQDIMQDKVQVKNTEKRKRTGLQGYWGAFVRLIGRILEIGKGESIDALSAFAVDVATFIQTVRELNVPRAVVTEPTLRKSTSSSQDQVNQMSSIEVMQTLPHTGNSDFGLHLNNLAETVISQVYTNDEVAKAQIDVIQAIQVAPAIKAGFNLSQREAAVQRSLELVLETYIETSKGGLNVGQLWKIYEEAQKNIKVESFYNGDWSKATPQERAATKRKFDYVMNSSNKGVESLARFISMGLATEEVHNLLGFNTISAKPSKQKTWFDTFNAWLRYVFAWVGNKLVKTSATDPANKQLQKLVNNLTALDIRNRQDTIALYEKAWNLVGKATAPLDKAAQTLRQYATNRDFLRNSKYLPLRTLGSIAALDAKAMGETIPKLIRETRDKARPNEKLGEAMNVLMESTAMTQIRKAMEALIRQANLNAKERQDRTDNVKKAIMSWFKDGGKHITKEMHKAITYTLLRTDAQSLLTTFGLNKTIGLLLDTNKLKNEIDLVTKDISQYPNGNSMINQSMRLAYYMVTNKGGLGLSKNPTAIAMGLGTNYQMKLEGVDQALVGQLDVLISLYAMKYTSAKDRKVLGDMYTDNPEALEGLLQMHKGFMTDAATEFKDNPLSYTKGWMPEIVNPYREVKVVNNFAKERMLKEGWKLIDEIKPQGSFLMVHPDIGYQRLVSGAVDLQNSHRKGTEIVNRTSRNYLDTVRANLDYTAHIASIPHTQFDPSKQATGLIPAYDTDGVPLGFNYEMASWVRDKEMERNNNFADLMGAYAGAMYYKPAKRNQSVTVANVLFEDYKQNYQKNPNSYIKLSGKSSDPRIVEMWRMLPKDFRQRAAQLYGKGEPIIINNEAFLLAFGFKKWTITSIWDKPADQRTKIETMFVTMAEKLLGDTAKARIAKGGHIWAEIVSKAKDFIVIRSIDVLWNNVKANGLMLTAYGINPVTIVKDWVFITANVRSYQKLHSELIQLKANTLAGNGNSATEAQIKRIESQLEANPMSKYINEGLLSSIVEDVTINQGDYTYDSELKKKIDNVTGWLPDSIKTIGAWAVLNPSTQGYQFLATTTQLSDFVAKVTLAKHLERKGMDFKAAVSEASQTFINYDVPQGVGMQYMNDMGLFMFTKFFLRIQAVLLKLMDKKAASVLAQHIAVESLTDMQGILDPMASTRVGNWPFEEGAFSIVGAAMSIAPVNVVF